jgi:DNA polymerase-3 subunit alpha
MAFIQVEDLQGVVEVIAFPEVFSQAEELLVEDGAVLVQGECQKEENTVRVIAAAIIPMARAEELWAASVHIALDTTRVTRAQLEKIQAIAARHRGACRAFFHLVAPAASETVIEAAEPFRLKAGRALIREIDALLGYPAVETRCAPLGSGPAGGGPGNGGNGRWRGRRP